MSESAVRYKVQYKTGSGSHTNCLHTVDEVVEYQASVRARGHTPVAWVEERIAGSGWRKTKDFES